MKVSLEDVKNNQEIRQYILSSDSALKTLGFTEHSFAHVTKVSKNASRILEKLGYNKKTVELAAIAGFMHDIGNCVNRINHAQSGACMAFSLLRDMGMEPENIATVISAIGNHDEGSASTIDPITAALILADKGDIRKSRVRHEGSALFDIHDRVNYAAKNAEFVLDAENKTISFRIDIDEEFSSTVEYFEIFLERMLLCKKAAAVLDLRFRLIINGAKMI